MCMSEHPYKHTMHNTMRNQFSQTERSCKIYPRSAHTHSTCWNVTLSPLTTILICWRYSQRIVKKTKKKAKHQKASELEGISDQSDLSHPGTHARLFPPGAGAAWEWGFLFHSQTLRSFIHVAFTVWHSHVNTRRRVRERNHCGTLTWPWSRRQPVWHCRSPAWSERSPASSFSPLDRGKHNSPTLMTWDDRFNNVTSLESAGIHSLLQ